MELHSRNGGEELTIDWVGYRQELLGRIGNLGRLTSQTVRGYREPSDAGKQTAHLEAKTREVMAIAVGAALVFAARDGCAVGRTTE